VVRYSIGTGKSLDIIAPVLAVSRDQLGRPGYQDWAMKTEVGWPMPPESGNTLPIMQFPLIQKHYLFIPAGRSGEWQAAGVQLPLCA